MSKKMTLEKHLHDLAEQDCNTKSLESVYDLQKRKLNRYMSSVLTTFPTYSSHDTVHSMSIISAMESILGEERITVLSGIDTFLLLMCAYMHDLGMLYTEKEVREIWESDEFRDFTEGCLTGPDELKQAAECITNQAGALDKDTWPLAVRKNVTILLMEFYRSAHGKRIENMTKKGDMIADLLRVEDSFLPERITRMINRISMAHTMSFENMMSSLVLTDSYQGEDFHPRLIAFLLRLGDLCDMDNNRFNRVSIATFGTLGEASLAHYFKHKSVETLYLSGKEICIIADVEKNAIRHECRYEWMKDTCDTPGFEKAVDNLFLKTIREHISWKKWMQQEVADAKLNTRQIFPEGMDDTIPEVTYKIKINGRDAVTGDQNLKFNFSQEKAFRLIEDISLYRGEKFIFIRELVQNALDASKIQLWREIRADIDTQKPLSPFELEQRYPGIYDRYKIDINVNYDRESRTAQFKIHDSGIGISFHELKTNILTTGKSWRERKEYAAELKEMPEWLRPTGAFGIGLHTVFSLANQMKIVTKSDREPEANQIILYSGKEDGYVFAEKIRSQVSRGSCFSFSFSLTEEQEKRYLDENDENIYLKDTRSDFENKVIEELQDWCKTPLFPVYVNMYPVVPSLTQSTWTNLLESETAKNNILGDTVVNDRYEFAFSYNYEDVIIWDRRSSVVMNLSLQRTADYPIDGEIALNFKGIHLEVPAAISHSSNCLSLQFMDILAGETNETIDAARTKLNDAAEETACSIIKDAQTFAAGLYYRLMEHLTHDEGRNALLSEINFCALGYLAKQMNHRQIWKHICKWKHTWLPNPEKGKVWLQFKIVTHLLILKVIDAVFLEMFRDEPSDIDDLEMLKKADCSVLQLIDDCLRRWKSDWKGNTERFNFPYFDDEICGVLEHYMTVWGFFLSDKMLPKRKIANVAEQKRCQNTIKTMFQENMPFVSTWSKTSHCYEIASDIVMHLRSAKQPVFFPPNIESGRTIRHLLYPASACCFNEWRFRGSYAERDGISLELSSPYMWLMIQTLEKSDSPTPLETSAWTCFVEQSVYGNLKLGITNCSRIADLLDVDTIHIDYQKDGAAIFYLPFLQNIQLQSIHFQYGMKRIAFSRKNTENNGFEADAEAKRNMLRYFWTQVEQTSPEKADVSYTLPGFSDYPHLVMQKIYYEYDQYTGMFRKMPYIPCWDYAVNIMEFMRAHEFDMEAAEAAGKIAADKKFDNVTNYIWKAKYGGNDTEILHSIRTEYEQFLQEITYVWYKHMPKG